VNFTPHFIEQRSTEWFQLRVGLLTGSASDALIAVRKRGTSELKARADLRRRLVCERITGLSSEGTFRSDAMQRGTDCEPLAFAAYEAMTGQVVNRVGFVQHATLKAGCSPDGYVGDWDGLIELKCPLSTTHLEYLLNPGTLLDAYRGQGLHALWLTGAQYIDLCSFDDRMPEALQLHRERLERSEFDMMAYGRTVEAFLQEVDDEEAKVRGLMAMAQLTESV
jgi:hypothetical protein